MNNTEPIRILDALTPENALEMGYVWHSDKIYIPDAPDIANEDLFTWVEGGGVIGQAAHPDFNDYAVGLYEPFALQPENTSKTEDASAR